LRCEAFGEQPIELIWLKDKRKLTGAGSGNDLAVAAEYSIEQVQLAHGAESWLTIAAAGREDSALYTCVAGNAHGHDETNVQLIVHEPPDIPNPPHTVEVAARSVKLAWQPPFNGNSPISGYVLEYRAIVDSSDSIDSASNALSSHEWHNITVRNGECVAQLGSLLPASTYELRLMAQNRFGFSDPGTVLRMRTEEEAPGSAPVGIRLASLSTKSVRVTWNPPDRKTQYGRLRGYYVGYRLVGGVGSTSGTLSNEQSQFVYKTVEATHGTTATVANFAGNGASLPATGTEQTVIGNLRRNSKYAFVVQAYNEKGAGPMSEEQQVITAELDPPETPSLRVQTTTAGSVQLAWQPVGSEQNPVDGYLLYQRQESSSEWREYSLDVQQTFYTAIGLHCGTR
jgi:Down syndrome cell adhesion protein